VGPSIAWRPRAPIRRSRCPKNGTAMITLVSDGSTIDNLGTTVIGTRTANGAGAVDNYATATLQSLSGPLITGSPTNQLLNF